MPKNFLENSRIKIGEEVAITVHDGKIIVEATLKICGRYDINDLAARMPEQYSPNEEEWGAPAGRESW